MNILIEFIKKASDILSAASKTELAPTVFYFVLGVQALPTIDLDTTS